MNQTEEKFNIQKRFVLYEMRLVIIAALFCE